MTQISENLAFDLFCVYNNSSFVSWLRLRQVCKAYHNVFSSKIFPSWCAATRKRIDSHIESLKIFDNMHSVTGGFLLDCIYDTNYSSDIDLLIINKKTFDYNEGFRSTKGYIDVMLEIYKLGYNTQKPWMSDCTPAIDFNVRKFSKPNSKNIDHIILHTFKTHKEFVDGFDFLFCKVYFDGNKLYISNVESIINQITNIDEEAIRNSLKMASYDIRPMDLNSPSIPYSDKVDHVFEKFIDRKIKYQKRGFVVKPMNDMHTQIRNIAKEMDL